MIVKNKITCNSPGKFKNIFIYIPKFIKIIVIKSLIKLIRLAMTNLCANTHIPGISRDFLQYIYQDSS